MKSLFYILTLICFAYSLIAQTNKKSANSETISIIKKTPGLVALWDFKERKDMQGKLLESVYSR
jgi:lysophospholipid acyltransferase (LPLAT)-like uncharacterized protein